MMKKIIFVLMMAFSSLVLAGAGEPDATGVSSAVNPVTGGSTGSCGTCTKNLKGGGLNQSPDYTGTFPDTTTDATKVKPGKVKR